MILSGVNRAPAILLAATVAGVLLWVAAAHIDRTTTGGYWAAYFIIGAAGLVFGLAQLRGAGGHPPATFLIAFLPVLIVAGWILVAMQPNTAAPAAHVRTWSSEMGILDVVRSVGTWLGVLAFGVGATLAAVLEPFGRRTRRRAEPVDERAASEPTTAERREVATSGGRRRTTVR